jgi:cytochrome oxidase assembly protein ShyY1
MRGRWLAGFVIAIVIAIIFCLLGVWQLNRNQEKHDKARRALAAYAVPAGPGRTEARGAYDPDPAHETLLRDRTRSNQDGFDVLTPLQLTDGSAVVVDRGWIPLNTSVPPPPTGPVDVRGLVHTAAATNPPLVEHDSGRVSVAVVDLNEIRTRVPYRIQNSWVEAQYQNPKPQRVGPALPVPPPVDPVNHMEYAIQWFAFALIPLGGWPVLMWRRAKRVPKD